MSEQIINEVPLGSLVPHDANMRRLYPIGPMAELTMQMLARGYDQDKPMLVQPIPKLGRQKIQKYRIIRGHRRRMARVFCLYLMEEYPDNDWEIGGVIGEWETAVAKYGSVPAVSQKLLAKSFSKCTVPAVEFQGDYKEGLCALWSDNFGEDKPDKMGSAHSFLEGQEAGFSVRQIAAQVGQAVSYVENLIALAGLDDQLALLIAEDKLGLGLASSLMSLPEGKRAGVVGFILGNDPKMLTVTRLNAAISRLDKWVGFQIPLLVPVQLHRNVARSLIEIWTRRLETNPDGAWQSAFTYFYNTDADYKEPYASVGKIVDWMAAFGIIASTERTSSLQKLGHFLPPEQVSCETCPVKQLPEEILAVDLSRPLLACRHASLRDKVQNCLHGLAPGDPFHVRVAPEWSAMPGVKDGDSPRPYVDSYEDLLTAYTARRELEAKRREEEERIRESQAAQAQATQQTATASADADANEPDEPSGPRPIDIMRGQIAAFMALHELMDGQQHMLAMTCKGCTELLDNSPTADPALPHCAAAARLRTVVFEKIVPVNGDSGFSEVPLCLQYKPIAMLGDSMPAYPGDVPIDRSMMLSQIRRFADCKNNKSSIFEWIIGGGGSRAGEQKGWLTRILDDEHGNLSDGQLFLMFLIAVAENGRVTMPWNGDGVFFVPESAANPIKWVAVKREKWSFDEV